MPESEAFGDLSAFPVLTAAADLDAIDLEIVKSITDQGGTRFRDKPFALKVGAEPIADLGLSVPAVEIVVTDLSGHFAAVPQAHFESLAVAEFLSVKSDPFAGPLHGPFSVLQPARPFMQVVEVVHYKNIQFSRVA